MKATDLYEKLETDFIAPSMSDDWADGMLSISEFLTESFKQRSMGLVCDNAAEISKVYTAVFPSDAVMQAILDRDETDALLFVHHPMIWDIRRISGVFQNMSTDQLDQFKDGRISIYNLHVPLDNYGEFSTSASLATALGAEITRPFFDYFGALAGVFATTEFTTARELGARFESVVGHRTNLYSYGADGLVGNKIAIVAGGGNIVRVLEEVVAEGVNTFLTGITVRNEYLESTHQYAEANRVNLLGGTHYSTEKFACRAMCRYFTDLDLPSEFVDDSPVMEDM